MTYLFPHHGRHLCLALAVFVGLAAAAADRRVADAAQARDWATVATLVKNRADAKVPQADGATALHWAAHWDHLETARLLLASGAVASAANDLGVTPLALAAENGSLPMVQALLDGGANPSAANHAGETVLMIAANTGNAAVIKALLAKGANPNAAERTKSQTALMWAAAEGHDPAVEALIEGKADIHARSTGGSTPLLFAAQSGAIRSVRALIAAGADVNVAMPTGETALLIAAGSGHGDLGVLLLEHGANPNAVTVEEQLSALQLLILKRPLHAGNWKRPADQLALAKALLARGANPNHQLAKPPSMGINVTGAILPGSTPLVLASRVADLDMIKLLIEGKSNPLIPATSKATPLMVAAGVGRSEGNEDPISEADALAAVKIFAEAGVDVNAADASGATALHGAVNNGYNAIIQYLFERGADLNPKDKDGWTPLNHAEIYRNNFREHKESAALLRKLGATESVPPPSSR